MFEDTKEAIRSRKWNGQTNKYKGTNNDLQSTTQKTKDRATLTPLKQRVNSGKQFLLHKDRQHNGQKNKYKRTNNDLQNTTQKTKDRATLTQQQARG
jgi:hypothetical protein